MTRSKAVVAATATTAATSARLGGLGAFGLVVTSERSVLFVKGHGDGSGLTQANRS